MSSRPEHTAPPELFYNDEEAHKYTVNSRMIQIQSELTRRCIELVCLPDEPCHVLDVGCGSGLSGQELSEDGHLWIGCDISASMLNVAVEREVDGDLIEHDMGHGLPFRPGSFDGIISVSALQWLCNADKRCHDPRKRLSAFFTTLYSSMARGARAAMQFYPENPDQMEMITSYAMRAGFSGGLVVDYPNSTRAKKIFLCLVAGGVAAPLPAPKGVDSGPATSAAFTASQRDGHRAGKHHKKGAKKVGKEWIIAKKERRRRQENKGEVRPDTKFTGRKRRPKF
eukprot:m.94772 g.94772  ORF g.94772 m.94772 type:complete len:283 (-) comp20398_c0_seq1:182-1030(-)